MNRKRIGNFMVAALVCVVASAGAEVRLPAIFSDHMVLEANMPLPVWGKATPGALVTVELAGKMAAGTADAQGFWRVTLPAMAPQEEPLVLTVREGSAAPVEVKDVLVGEVWMGCGQSNMAYPLSSMDGKEPYLEKAKNEEIRYFSVEKRVSPSPLGLRPGMQEGDVQGKWVVSDDKNAAGFSAVGVLFAEELQAKLQRPVGIIGSNWGGTPIQIWMSLDAFSLKPSLAVETVAFQKALAKHNEVASDPGAEAKYKAVFDAWYEHVGKAHDAAMTAWNKVNDAGGDAGPRPPLSQPEPRNPDPMGRTYGSERPATPTSAYNAMIAPLQPFAVKGVLWYQGEANVSHWKEYGDLLQAMVQDWRRTWSEPNMDFFVVQLPAFGKNQEPRDLPRLREAQASVLSLPHTALAVAFDVGSPGNVHPRSKVAVSQRLVADALGEAYGQHVPYLGPVVTGASVQGGQLTLHFKDDGGGMAIGHAPWMAPDAHPTPDDRLVGFELAGSDGKYQPATAKISGTNIVLTADGVTHPAAVRYAWDQSPFANLYDAAGLPARPFTMTIQAATASR